jgi:two-component system, cell cycle sensor histidine kinase and response regulator CckA
MDPRLDLENWKGREVVRLLELASTERRYLQEIIASIPVAVAVVSACGEILTFNRKFSELFQLKSPETKHKIQEFLPSPDLPRSVRNTIEQAAPSTLVIESTQGAIEVALAPVPGWGGADSPGEAVLTIRPPCLPPAQAAAEVDGAPAVVWSIDPASLRFLAVSGDSEQILGTPRDHWLRGATAPDRVHPSQRAEITQFLRTAISAGGDFSCEFRLATTKGNERWNRDAIRVSRPASGTIEVTGVTTDVTGLRRVHEHTIQANRADALVGLSRRLAHDLNNALMVISGYGEELLAQFPDDDPHRSDVQAVMSAAETIAGIAGELLGFTRTQAAPHGTVPISEILTTVSTRIRAQLGAVLVTRVLDETLTACAEAEQLEAILLSLARAMRSPTDPHMILTAARRRINDYPLGHLSPEPAEYVEIAFRAPVDSALDPRAFENLLSGRDPHGADLARAFAVIRDWGGWIRAARTEQSAEVRVLLRIPTPPSDREAEPPPLAAPVLAAAPVKADKATVLIVEDEDGIRTLVQRILDREGYHVLEASGAAAVEETVRSHSSIDLLITDVRLPGESGPELATRLRAPMPNLKVIYMSGFTDDPALPAQLSAEDVAFLQKPFTRTALLRKIHELLPANSPDRQ